MRLRRLAPLACALAALAAAPAAAHGPAVEIHAHRGAPLENGVPSTPENSMAAFRRATELGADVIELDAKLTRDDVPVVFHDATLDAVTDCTGRVRDHQLAQLAACPIAILGTTSGTVVRDETPTEPIPTLAEVLAWARDGGARLNLEIKNIPTDPDFDRSPAFARAVLDAVDASGIPREQVLVQSFWPPNLDEAEARGYETSLLTLQALDEPAIPFALARGYEWLSPQWPPLQPSLYVSAAHSAGRRVAAWTLDDPARIAAARDAHVDAVITNDVPVARGALGR